MNLPRNDLDLVIAKISADQRFVLINHVIHDSPRYAPAAEYPESDNKTSPSVDVRSLSCPCISGPKTHQAVFQSQHKLIELQYKNRLTVFAAAFCIFFIEKLFFDLVTAVFAVADRIPELPVGKHIKTHLPDILLAKLRQNVGNIV